MRALIILIGSMIFIQLHAQHSPATVETAGKENTIWRTFKTDEQIPAQQLAQSKNLLQLSNDDNLTLFSTDTDQLGYTHYRYQQTYKDIPIEGAVYLMHEKAGRIKHANGRLARQLELNAVPSISVDAALSYALAHTNAQVYAWDAPTYESSLKQIRKSTDATFYPVGQLVIINPELPEETAAYRLAYKFDIYAVEPLSREVVYIDAHTGEVLATLEKIHHCTGEPVSGATHYSENVDFTACQSGGTYTLESDLGGGIQTFNANNTYSYPQIPFTDADDFFEADSAAVEVQWATEKVYEYFRDAHSRNSLDGNDMPLHSWVHYRDEYNNAFWNGSWMTYGDGDNERFSSLTAPDVVGHEMMHGITDFSADLMYEYESGALNESFSDIFGEVIEAACNPDDGNDWIIGGDFTIESGKNGLRNMSNPNDPTMLTQQPDTYLGDYWHFSNSDNGGVHYNSGVQNYWFYLLCEGGSGVNDNGYAYDVTTIGMEKAAAIAYYNLTSYLESDSQYEDARMGAIQAATNLYGENSEEVAQVTEAWCAVGVGECVNCEEDDYIALRALYLSTDGDNWTDNSGWLTEAEFIANPTMPEETNMSTWHGVITSSGCVNFLLLGNNQLNGNIPPELSNLNELKYLYLNNNQLTGSIPPELGSLNNVSMIDLTYNQLIDGIPSELGSLGSLSKLYLSENQLIGNIPPELGNIVFLERLYLTGNQLTGNIPPELGNLNDLRDLYLDENELDGSIPSELGNLESLFELRLNDNQLSGCYPVGFTSLCNHPSFYISSGNNFDAPWEDFCATQTGICPPPNCQEDDYVALRALYLSTDGDNWTDNTGWLNEAEFMSNPTMPVGTNVDMWYGVVTNVEGCVTCIDMDGNDNCSLDNSPSGNNLSGGIPPELGNLSNLRTLYLFLNQLSGSIPPELGNLSNLTDLRLSGNQLSGSIPPELGNLSNLIDLALSSNQLSGSIPSELGNLSKLTWLWMQENQLSGSIPSELGNLSNLTYMDLHGNQLSGSIPSELGNLSNLTYMSLWNNELSESIPPELGDLSNLRTLYLWDNDLSGSIPPELSNLSNLRSLYLSYNDLSGSIPPELSNLSNLRYLYLDNNELNDSIPSELGNLSNLRYLRLYGNQLSGSIPSELGNLSNLRELYLYSNELSGSIPLELGNLNNLIDWGLNDNNLSSCYDSNLLNFCTQLNTWSNTNGRTSDGNTFDAPWEDFCATQAGICNNTTDVYPGDFNNDGTANIQDLIYWGIVEGYEGIFRPDATIGWQPQPCADWTISAYGINSKHQDGDGNGLIDNLDLEALIANYDITHSFAPSGIESPLQFVFEPVDYVDEGDSLRMTYEIYIESSLGSPVSLHGLALGLDFGGLPINSLVVDFDNSVLIPEEVMDVYNPLENKLDIALTRTDKVNQICDGSLLTAIVVTDDLDLVEPFTFQVNGGQLMTTGGIDETDGALTAISSSTLTSVVSSSGLFVAVNATPVQCNVGGTAEVSYTNGTAPYTYTWSTGENTTSISDLNIGTHHVTVTDADGSRAMLEFDIEWAFTPISARTDGDKICIDLENAPLTEPIEISIDNGDTYMSPVTTNICYDVPEGEYRVWVRQADLQCPVYLDSLSVLLADKETIDNNPLTIKLFNTLENQSEIVCLLDRNCDMGVQLYNTHGQLIRIIEAVHVQAGEHRIKVDKNDLPVGLYYIHVEYTTKNHPPINTILKLPVIK